MSSGSWTLWVLLSTGIEMPEAVEADKLRETSDEIVRWYESLGQTWRVARIMAVGPRGERDAVYQNKDLLRQMREKIYDE